MKWHGRAIGVAALLLLLATVPTRAGTAAYGDPEGDATAVERLQLSRPSDPELDLREVSWSTTADEVVITTSLTELGEPVASDGWAIGHYFTYEDVRFEVLLQNGGPVTSAAFGPAGVYLRVAGDSSTEYPCVCRFSAHPERSAVIAHVELHSIWSAVRAIDSRMPRPTAGSHFTSLATTSYRVAGALLSADHAAAPEGATLVL